jgi:hypothetical protein
MFTFVCGAQFSWVLFFRQTKRAPHVYVSNRQIYLCVEGVFCVAFLHIGMLGWFGFRARREMEAALIYVHQEFQSVYRGWFS